MSESGAVMADHVVPTSDGADWGATFSGTSMAAYEATLVGQMFEPWGEHLLDRVGVREGESLLDVACGPGTVARLAAGRVGPSGSVVACDLSGEMLAIARSKEAPGGASVDYRQCTAEDLSVDDDAFDVAVCQQGLQFFGDRSGALRELRRALRAGGRTGVSVWCEIEASEPFAALADAIAEVLGADVARGYRNGPWGFSNAQQLRDEFEAVGFVDVEVSRDEITVEFEDADHLIRTLGAAPVGVKVQALDPGGRLALHEAVERTTATLVETGRIRGITTSHTATGTA